MEAEKISIRPSINDGPSRYGVNHAQIFGVKFNLDIYKINRYAF